MDTLQDKRPINPSIPFRCIYFDLDDTLCGYWDAAKAGLKFTFETVPVPGFTPEEVTHAWVEEFRTFADDIKRSHWYEIYLSQGGVTRMELMRMALQRLGIDNPELAFTLGKVYGQARAERLSLFEGATELLTALQGKVTLGVITNGPADIQRQELRDLGIESAFQLFFIEGEMGEGKPEPRVMQRATDQAQCAPDQILMVGNSFKHDIVPAQKAGWKTAWIRRPSDVPPTSRNNQPEERPESSIPPDYEINSLWELFPIIGLPLPART